MLEARMQERIRAWGRWGLLDVVTVATRLRGVVVLVRESEVLADAWNGRGRTQGDRGGGCGEAAGNGVHASSAV